MSRLPDLDELLGYEAHFVESLRGIRVQIANERRRIRLATAEAKLAAKKEANQPFAMQAAKEKELRRYIKALRLKVRRTLKEKKCSESEIVAILGVSYQTLLQTEKEFLCMARRLEREDGEP